MTHFLIHSLAAAGVADIDDPSLDEQHWSYTDPYAATMIARGPTLDSERREWTGSIHILDLPDLDTVRRYIDNEPYHRAGAYRAHRIWHFDNLLGSTMRDAVRIPDHNRYFVLPAEANDGPAPVPNRSAATQGLVILGRLHEPRTGTPQGVALAAQVPSRQDLDTVMEQTVSPLATHAYLDIIDWEFGGRR